jgi:putative transposase
MLSRYRTDLTDAEWEILRPHIPEAIWFPNLRKPKYQRRDIVNAIFYRERTGCQWRNLPHDFPPWKQVFEYYRKWRNNGVIQEMHDALRDQVRRRTPHANGTPRTKSPSICILDSQSAKGSEECEEGRGFDAGKKIKGRKRHLVVDALGLLLAVQVTSASVQDRDAALPLFRQVSRDFKDLEVAFADGGYRGEVKSQIEKKTGLRVQISLRSDAKKKDSCRFPFGGLWNAPSDG